jgi:hypothetical protein
LTTVADRKNHVSLGFILEFCVIGVAVAGYLTRGLILFMGSIIGVKTSHWRIIWVLKNVHKLFGKLLILYSIWTMLAGSFSYEDGWNYIKYLLLTHWAGYLIATLVLEIIHCSRRRHKKYGTDLVFPSTLPEMTISDFDREVNKGAQWCLFDNYVIDLKPFIASHPGGPFLLWVIVGQDVGQFLNGSLTNMDNPTLNKFKDFFKAAPHSHSSYAYSILATLAIGKVYREGQ